MAGESLQPYHEPHIRHKHWLHTWREKIGRGGHWECFKTATIISALSWVVQSWVKITQGYYEIWFHRKPSLIIFVFYLIFGCSKKNWKIIWKRLLNGEIKKPGFQFNPRSLLISLWTTRSRTTEEQLLPNW